MTRTSRKTTIGEIFEKFVTMVLLVLMSFELVNENLRIQVTALQLFDISWEISDYNAEQVKTDEMTERIVQVQEKRKKIYNSDDLVLRVFSNSPKIVKIIIFILTTLGNFFIICLWIEFIFDYIKKVRERIKKFKKSK